MNSPFGKEARKSALEQAIPQWKADKDQPYAAIKEALVKQLKNLLEFNRKPDAKNTAEKKALEEIRKYLREEIIKKETLETRALCDQAFQLQLMLAKHWPVNTIDEEGCEVIDLISLDPINTLDEAIPLSSGYLILKTSLTQFYKGPRAYIGQVPRHPISTGIPLSQREIDHLINQEINFSSPEHRIPELNPIEQAQENILYLREVIQDLERLIQRVNRLRSNDEEVQQLRNDIIHHRSQTILLLQQTEEYIQSLVHLPRAALNPPPQNDNLPDPLSEQELLDENLRLQLQHQRLMNNTWTGSVLLLLARIIGFLKNRYLALRDPTGATNKYFITSMLTLGVVLGCFVVAVLGFFVPPFFAKLQFILLSLSPIGGIINLILKALILSSAIIAATIAAYRAALGEKFIFFCNGLLEGMLAATLFLSLGLIIPGIVIRLAASAVISTTSLSVLPILAGLLPLFPALPALYAITREFIHPGFLNSFFHKIFSGFLMVTFAAPILACGILCGETAHLLSRAASAIRQALNPEPAHQDSNRPSINAQIHHDLGFEQVAIAPNRNNNSHHANADPRPVIHGPPSAPILAEEKNERSVLSLSP